MGSSYSPRHSQGQRSKSKTTHPVKQPSAARKKCFKSTGDVSDLFLVHQGRGTTHLPCFWNTLVVLDFVIFVIVACRLILRDNRNSADKFLCLSAPHVEFYDLATILTDFLCKVLAFCTTHGISCYIGAVHPHLINPCRKPTKD
jgi:hypothetical protein